MILLATVAWGRGLEGPAALHSRNYPSPVFAFTLSTSMSRGAEGFEVDTNIPGRHMMYAQAIDAFPLDIRVSCFRFMRSCLVWSVCAVDLDVVGVGLVAFLCRATRQPSCSDKTEIFRVFFVSSTLFSIAPSLASFQPPPPPLVLLLLLPLLLMLLLSSSALFASRRVRDDQDRQPLPVSLLRPSPVRADTLPVNNGLFHTPRTDFRSPVTLQRVWFQYQRPDFRQLSNEINPTPPLSGLWLVMRWSWEYIEL